MYFCVECFFECDSGWFEWIADEEGRGLDGADQLLDAGGRTTRAAGRKVQGNGDCDLN